MAAIITQGVEYQQLLDDVRALIRHEMSHLSPPAATTASSNDEPLTVRAAAGLLGVSVATLHEWKRRGLLPYFKLGGRVYLQRSDVITAGTRHQRSEKPARSK